MAETLVEGSTVKDVAARHGTAVRLRGAPRAAGDLAWTTFGTLGAGPV